jgi:endonuclease III
MDRPQIAAILDLLKQGYGSRQFQPSFEPIAELIQTILSQNTSDHNSRPAFRALKEAFPVWDSLLSAEVEEIAEPIKGGGLGLIKAQRLKQALKEIKSRRGKLDLQFLSDMSVQEARDWLRQLPGVGYKTANCVLLFALGKPALPVDTHIFRVSRRLELIDQKDSPDKAHLVLERLVPKEDVYEFHVLMIEHGRRTCIAQRPRCTQCILKEICPSYSKSTAPPVDRKG